jgi:methionyl-tRNA formyltransferase
VNVHTSILPKYRGAAPINYAIFNGDKETGITLMYMDKSLDTGDIIKQEGIEIDKDETYSSLYAKMESLASKMIRENLDYLFSTDVIVTKQNNELATFTRKIDKETEEIKWSQPAHQIDCIIRGLYNKPIARCSYNGINIKIHKASVIDNNENYEPGHIIKINKEGILVQTGKNCILLTKIQLPGKKPVEISSLINGRHIFVVGTKFN